jgi:hypothetical protein
MPSFGKNGWNCESRVTVSHIGQPYESVTLGAVAEP